MSPKEIIALADKLRIRQARLMRIKGSVVEGVEVRLLTAERDAIIQGLQLLAINLVR